MVSFLADESFLHRTGIAKRKKETLFPAPADDVPVTAIAVSSSASLIPISLLRVPYFGTRARQTGNH
jgi:hypothetical protein